MLNKTKQKILKYKDIKGMSHAWNVRALNWFFPVRRVI